MKILAGFGIGALWALADFITDRQFGDLPAYVAGVVSVYVWQA